MSIDDIANHVDVDAEILVHQDVAEIPNLRPDDLRVRAGDLIGKMVHGFAGLRLTAAPRLQDRTSTSSSGWTLRRDVS